MEVELYIFSCGAYDVDQWAIVAINENQAKELLSKHFVEVFSDHDGDISDYPIIRVFDINTVAKISNGD